MFGKRMVACIPDGIQDNKLDLPAVAEDAHHGLGYLVHGAVGSRSAVVVRRAHRQHHPAVARLEQRQRTPTEKRVQTWDKILI